MTSKDSLIFDVRSDRDARVSTIHYGEDPLDPSYDEGYRAYLGTHEPVMAAERDAACRNADHVTNHVYIQLCTEHEYEYDAETKTYACIYCGHAAPAHTVTFVPGEGTGESVTRDVKEGEPLTLPKQDELGYECGLKELSGWARIDEGATDTTIYKPGETVSITEDGVIFEVQWTLTWKRLQELINTVDDRATLVLPSNVVAEDDDTSLVVPANKTITLNLNGSVINRNLRDGETAQEDGTAIVVKGNLIVTDRLDGGIIGGGWDDDAGGGVYVADGGSLTLKAGSIAKCTATYGGGVYVDTGGTFVLEGGGVSENTATGDGGGINVATGARFTMKSSSAVVAQNTAEGKGGGICVSGGTATMVGGQATLNQAENGGGVCVEAGTFVMNVESDGQVITNIAESAGGGVYVASGGDFELSGLPLINENASGRGTPWDNVYLENDALITVPDTLDPSGNMNIGVGVQTPPAEGSSVVLTEGLDGRGSYDRFTSENDGFMVGRNAQGEAILGAPVTVSFAPGKGSGEMDSVTVATGSSYELPDSGFEPPRGLDFAGWKEAEDAELRTAGSSMEVSGSIILTAQFGKDYDVWVGGVRVTDANCDDVLGDGTVVFVPRNNALILKNPTLTSTYSGAAIYAENLNLIVGGTATIGQRTSYGIHVFGGTVTLEGDLTINGDVRGVYADAITVASGTVNVTGGEWGLAIASSASGGITVKDGVKRLEVDAPKPCYAREDSITIGDSLYIETPAGGSVSSDGKTASVVDAAGDVPSRVLIVPYHIDVTKTWVDDGAPSEQAHDSVTVRLMADGKEVASGSLSQDNDWAQRFEVPYASNGEKIDYVVTEDAVPDYVSQVEDAAVTNTYSPGKTHVNVTKAWVDEDNADGVRPESATVHLLADEVDTGKTLVLSEKNEWSGAFENLDLQADGKDITYTVSEDDVEHYSAEVTGDATTGFWVVNTHVPETTDIPVRKVWDDDDRAGIRPEAVRVHLFANGTEVAAAVLQDGEESEGWAWTFAGMRKYAQGKEIAYTLTENTVSRYSSEIAGDATEGFTVTNTHTPDTVGIRGNKHWNDEANRDGIRPETVTVTLTGTVTNEEGASETVFQEEKTVINNRWMWSVPKYDAGRPVTYTVAETDKAGTSTVAEGYEATVSGYSITNTHTPEKVEVAGSMTWADDDNRDGVRPESVQVHLMQDGIEVDSQTVLPDDTGAWAWSFGERTKNEDGKPIPYTIVVDEVEGYSFAQDEGSYDVVGSHVPETIALTVVKVWDDGDNQDSIRPDSLLVSVKAGETYHGSVTLSRDNQWRGTVSDLYKFENGQEIAYEWEEWAVPDGYTLTSTETEGTVTTLTNTHEPAAVDTAVRIVWVDGDDEDGLRPKKVTATLMRSGVRMRDVELNEEGG